jgi:protein transport protein SEC13
LATCSSDRTIKIFDVFNGEQQKKPIAELKGHDGPVWQVCWAHPQFGNLLASCSYDHRLIIWKEQSSQSNAPSQWIKFYEYKHNSSVNAIAWAPHELGLCLASASSDTSIAITTFDNQRGVWETYVPQCMKEAHRVGCNAICWAPSAPSGSLLNASAEKSAPELVKRLISGGGDNEAKIWRCESGNNWMLERSLNNHTDWVRDVAWAPNIGLPYDMIATASQDQTVCIFTSSQSGSWELNCKLKFDFVVWRVSWSLTGNILAVTTADNKVTLYKENLEGQEKKWSVLATMGNTNQGNNGSNGSNATSLSNQQ